MRSLIYIYQISNRINQHAVSVRIVIYSARTNWKLAPRSSYRLTSLITKSTSFRGTCRGYRVADFSFRSTERNN